MTKEPFFKYLKPFPQLIMLLAITAGFAILFSLLSHVVIMLFFGLSIDTILNIPQNLNDPQVIQALKGIQVISQIGIFLIPPLVFAKLTQTKRLKEYFGFKAPKDYTTFFWAIVSVITIIPLIGYLTYWNMNMNLPESMAGIEQWMQSKEQTTTEIMKAFLNTSTLSGLMFNLFMIALLAAIGEELLFRGVLQQLLSKLFANVHLGILVTAILFSAIHMQFFGFLPRIVLGLVLGYAFYLSGNIWMPVVIHFVNNAFAVVIAHLYYNDLIQQNFDEFGITTKALPVILSVILTLYVFYRIHINERKPPITESQTQ